MVIAILNPGKPKKPESYRLMFPECAIRTNAETTWGVDAETPRTSTLSINYSPAQYCSYVWLNSTHRNKVDTGLNQTMRIIYNSIKILLDSSQSHRTS